jgi:hypothetical protein
MSGIMLDGKCLIAFLLKEINKKFSPCIGEIGLVGGWKGAFAQTLLVIFSTTICRG